MLGGFDPRTEQAFFQRKRGWAVLIALVLYATVVGWALTGAGGGEEEVEVQLEPEIKDFAVEEEPEEEKIEEEPPPPPPPDAKVKVVKNPKPKPKIKTPDKKVTEAAAETDQEKTYEIAAGQKFGDSSSAGGRGKKEPTPKPKAQPQPEPKPEGPKKPKIDPTKPIDRPENATLPKPDPGNAQPVYPKALQEEGITGEIVLKIHIHRDGTVKGAKILRKKSTATTSDDQARAEKAFLGAAIAAVKTWRYTPAKLNGQPISIWYPVTIPFTLR